MCFRFQAMGIVMANQVFVLLLVSLLIFLLALLWRLGWLFLQPFHAQTGKRRTLVHRLLGTAVGGGG